MVPGPLGGPIRHLNKERLRSLVADFRFANIFHVFVSIFQLFFLVETNDWKNKLGKTNVFPTFIPVSILDRKLEIYKRQKKNENKCLI
jgi:hypothetical protein